MTGKLKKVLLLNLPYLIFVYAFDKISQAVRLAPGIDASQKLLHISRGFSEAFSNMAPSFHLLDLGIGIAGAVIVRLAVYAKGKNAKKYRRGMEYGSARWGTAADIAPYVDPVPDWNIPLTQTEKLTMSSRPKIPKYARNKNILVIGGSGSGKTRLQELISDISHQVKTPIANLKMVNATLLDQDVPSQKQREFLLASGTQLDKLDFLMQAMIKTSRLETGVISLEKKQQPIYDTLAAALGGIFLNAEKKHIQVEVNCPETLTVSHDPKWTGEALFNILDNAVKYTPEGGSIHVSVESWEMYLKISITDTGKGIPENRQGTIFKRFYREEDVHDVEGIGIGLYLTREIVAMQGGYITVVSEVGVGSTFSIFLPHK